MPFDRNDPADLLALKNEVNNDPLGLGYSSATNVDGILALLNDPANNSGGETGNSRLTAEELLKMILAENLSAGDLSKVHLLFEMTQGEEADLSRFKAEVSALDNGLANRITALVRALSRAEVLFSVDDSNGVKEYLTISQNDWVAARDS